MAQDVIKDKKKTYYTITDDFYEFRNIPKSKFNPKSYQIKVVGETRLLYGNLKTTY